MDDVFGNSSTETVVSLQDSILKDSPDVDTTNESSENLQDLSFNKMLPSIDLASHKLRQIQSELICRSSPEPLRPRAQSTITTQSIKYHPYQNVPRKNSPVYMNLPHREKKQIRTFSPPDRRPYMSLWADLQKHNDTLDTTVNSDSSVSTNGYVQMTSPYVRSNPSAMTDISSQRYCPFCNCQQERPLSMLGHIRTCHKTEMASICQNSNAHIQTCGDCQCQFFASEALSIHLLTCHKEKVVELISRDRTSKDTCPFCSKLFTQSSNDTLLYHILHGHRDEYMAGLKVRFPLAPAPFSTVAGLLNGLALNPGSLTPGLFPRFRKLSCDIEDESPGVEICESSLNTSAPERILSSTSESSGSVDVPVPKRKVKRELRFSIQSNDDMEPQSTNPPNKTFKIPVRVDSLSSVEFIELSSPSLNRKRKRIGSTRSKKSQKKRNKENAETFEKETKVIGKTSNGDVIVSTGATKVFRKPKASSHSTPRKVTQLGQTQRTKSPVNDLVISSSQLSPLTSLKLFSAVSLFCCSVCHTKFYDNDTLKLHVAQKHKGLLSLLRHQFSCGLCLEKFYDNKSLARHCLQRHTSLLEIREGPYRVIQATPL